MEDRKEVREDDGGEDKAARLRSLRDALLSTVNIFACRHGARTQQLNDQITEGGRSAAPMPNTQYSHNSQNSTVNSQSLLLPFSLYLLTAN